MDLDAPADLATLVLAGVGQGPHSPRLGPIKPGDVLPAATFDLPEPDPGSHFAHGDLAKPDERAASVGFDLTNPREEIPFAEVDRTNRGDAETLGSGEKVEPDGGGIEPKRT